MGYPNTPDFTRAELLVIGLAVAHYRTLYRSDKRPTPNMNAVLRKIRTYLQVEAELEPRR